MDSILTSIKKLLGITEEYDAFDQDIIMHINTVMGILTQLGIGPTEGFSISDKETTWADYLGDDHRFEMVKSYIYLKVRMMFDPSLTSTVNEAITRNISELEWRLNAAAETPSQNG